MRILVTGGCGFVGTNFIRNLLTAHPDWTIVNLDTISSSINLCALEQTNEDYMVPGYHFIQGNIKDYALILQILEEYRLEALINFAAKSHVDRSIDDPTPCMDVNIIGTQTLLECSKIKSLKRFVQISTCEVYGDLGCTEAFSEIAPLAPNTPYSASKAAADLICRAYYKTYGLPVVVTRCSNNYGPYQQPNKFIPLMILNALRKESLPIYGNGRNIRDWLWVKDHCRGIELALTNGQPGEIYNFGGAFEYTNLDVVRYILKILGRSESLISFVQDRPGHDKRHTIDSSKASRELGFVPSLDFDTGLTKTIQWYLDNPAWLNLLQKNLSPRLPNKAKKY